MNEGKEKEGEEKGGEGGKEGGKEGVNRLDSPGISGRCGTLSANWGFLWHTL